MRLTYFWTMAALDEKPEADHQSAEVVKTSGSLKEKDAENPVAPYLPRSDEEYNVTLKTWCVVIVSIEAWRNTELVADAGLRFSHCPMELASGLCLRFRHARPSRPHSLAIPAQPPSIYLCIL